MDREFDSNKLYDPTKTPEQNGVLIRFGHATHATPDQAAKLKALGVIAEVNLSSNVETGSVHQHPLGQGVQFDDHSLLHLIDNDVPVILSTDAHGVMHTDLAKEYATADAIIDAFINGKS